MDEERRGLRWNGICEASGMKEKLLRGLLALGGLAPRTSRIGI